MAPSAFKRVFALLALATIGSTITVSDSTNGLPGIDALATTPLPISATRKSRTARRRVEPGNGSSEPMSGLAALGCVQVPALGKAEMSDPHMTPQVCRERCAAAAEGAAFGIAAATKCYCTVDVALLTAVTDVEPSCTLPACPDGRRLPCGGEAGMMMVYAATDAEAPGSGRTEGLLLSEAAGRHESENEGERVELRAASPEAFPDDGEEDGDADEDDHEPSSAPGGVHLGTTATIGIAVGAVALSGVITGIVMLLFCRRRRGRQEKSRGTDRSRGRGIYERAGPMPPMPPPLSTDRGPRKPHDAMAVTVPYTIPESQDRGPGRDTFEMSERWK
ncbi:hypothetical protein D7B24_004357 [Verticillium nonalfalfae]|uniref:WSC domain-containing protein n=1 Tax=Verticillium nonalfalfae TaxID=1051616 RepID=A0A3M9YF58_9PEZI|nr:uncharacterized protein D7B24_004357 [Verticillium nonalfalfae]RNJ58721.1 hypothetical protein D7B24_004357 [Verticillium nonalfalfae]